MLKRCAMKAVASSIPSNSHLTARLVAHSNPILLPLPYNDVQTREEALDYYSRKIKKLVDNSDQLKKLLSQKHRDLDQVESILQRKLYQLQNAK